MVIISLTDAAANTAGVQARFYEEPSFGGAFRQPKWIELPELAVPGGLDRGEISVGRAGKFAVALKYADRGTWSAPLKIGL